MRLPNGYGSVIKLHGSRRRPYLARKTVGYDASNKQIYSTIGSLTMSFNIYENTTNNSSVRIRFYSPESPTKAPNWPAMYYVVGI